MLTTLFIWRLFCSHRSLPHRLNLFLAILRVFRSFEFIYGTDLSIIILDLTGAWDSITFSY